VYCSPPTGLAHYQEEEEEEEEEDTHVSSELKVQHYNAD
jgi:hypothetical protein